MQVLGITGPSGAGKSVFCGYLREAGCVILDCDAIYHSLIAAPSDCTRELAAPENFGPGILNEDGSVNRRALAAVVFAAGNETKLENLNRISHRHVTVEILRELDALRAAPCPPAAVLIDAPLLFQAGMESLCDKTVALVAGRKNRLSRLSERDRLDEASLNARLDAAPPDTYYTERADVTVVNDRGLPELRRKAEALLRKLKISQETK